MLASRRGSVTTVVRARGASGPWLVLRRGGEALLMVAPRAGRGDRPASGPCRESRPSWPTATAALAAAAACALVVTAAQVVPRPEPGGSQLQAVLGDALQLGAVALAVTVSVLVLLGGSIAPDDPLLLVLPPLVGTAAAVVVVRGLQLVLGGLRRAARRSRPVAPVVALSQAAAVARRVVVATHRAGAGGRRRSCSRSPRPTRCGAAPSRPGGSRSGPTSPSTPVGCGPRPSIGSPPSRAYATVAPVFTADSVSVDTRTGVEGVTVVGVDPEQLAAVGEGLAAPSWT